MINADNLVRLAACGLLALAPPLCEAATTNMISIPGGSYIVGSDDGSAAARPEHVVEIAPFRIDVHEVTNAAFVRYLETLDVRVVGDAAAGGVRADDLEGADAALLFTDGAERPLAEIDDSDARIALASGRFVPAPGFANHPVTEVTCSAQASPGRSSTVIGTSDFVARRTGSPAGEKRSISAFSVPPVCPMKTVRLSPDQPLIGPVLPDQ